MTPATAALRVSGLNVTFPHAAVPAVQQLSFSVAPGQSVALVGASGSGKTTTCKAVLGLLPPTARVTGSISLAGVDLLGLPERELRRHRGPNVAMVFQSPDAALDPNLRVGSLIAAALRRGGGPSRREAVERTLDLLLEVQLADPEQVYDSYPHQLSGGMRQRVLIALALSQQPRVLIADEATTALDTTTQAAVMDLLAALQRKRRLAIVLVTHDIALATCYADDIVTMHRGRGIDSFPATAVRAPGRDPRTAELVHAATGARRPARPSTGLPIIDVTDLVQDYGYAREVRSTPALAGVSLEIRHGECLAVVGESGSGKSTLAHSILQLPPPTSGRVRVDDLRDVQLVFQDPLSSLDPTWRVEGIVAEPLRARGLRGSAARRRVQEVLDLVGLDPSLHRARPRELSGGQVQQVAIARALAPAPSLLICDEPVSSLDTVAKARIIAVLNRLQDELGLACLFISHDLRTVGQLSDRVAVMHRGKLCEIGPSGDVLDAPAHPCTAALRAVAPTLGGRARRQVSLPPPLSVSRRPAIGCLFRERCPYAADICRKVTPPMRELTPGHSAACHFPLADPRRPANTGRQPRQFRTTAKARA